MKDYTDFDGFDQVYLEDSWVVAIMATPGRLLFRCEIVLREGHPMHRTKRVEEQYCYGMGVIDFKQVASLHWDDQGRPPSRDPDG